MPELYGISIASLAMRLLAAIVVGSVIGIERESKNRPAGLRTHALVCFGACIVAIVESCLTEQVIQSGAPGVAMNVGRIASQVISGIGFLGAGTILTARKKVTGLTTAASLWNVACLGLASGYGYYWLSLLGCAIVMSVLLPMHRIMRTHQLKKLEVRFVHRTKTLAFIKELLDEEKVDVIDVDFHVENTKPLRTYTNVYELRLPRSLSYADFVARLSEYEDIESLHTLEM